MCRKVFYGFRGLREATGDLRQLLGAPGVLTGAIREVSDDGAGGFRIGRWRHVVGSKRQQERREGGLGSGHAVASRRKVRHRRFIVGGERGFFRAGGGQCNFSRLSLLRERFAGFTGFRDGGLGND